MEYDPTLGYQSPKKIISEEIQPRFEVCPCGVKCLQIDNNWTLSERVLLDHRKASPTLSDHILLTRSSEHLGLDITGIVLNPTRLQNGNILRDSIDRDNVDILDNTNIHHGVNEKIMYSRNPADRSHQIDSNSSSVLDILDSTGVNLTDKEKFITIQDVTSVTKSFSSATGKQNPVYIDEEALDETDDTKFRQCSSEPDGRGDHVEPERHDKNTNNSNCVSGLDKNYVHHKLQTKDAEGKRAKTAGKANETKKKKKKKGGSKIKNASLDEDEKWLRWIQKQFQEIAGEDGEIDLQEFKGALKVKKSFFAERFFSLFDQDKSGSIEMNELMEGLLMLTKGTPKEKLKFLFDVYDVDGSGCIDPDELKTVLKSCMDESSLSLSEDALDQLTMTLFESADEDNSGEITFEELVAELERHPGVLENLTISAVNWLKPPEKKPTTYKPRYLSMAYIKNNTRKVVFILVYLLINIALFTVSAVRYRQSNWCVIIARGCGMDLNFNGAFVLVLMLRYCLTWVRSTKVGNYLPLDQSVLFHKMVGLNIAFLSAVHTLAHLGNLGYVMQSQKSANSTEVITYWEYLFTLKGMIGWVGPGFAYLSGILLDVVLAIMVLCSMPWVRRSGHFQVFYWTHMLYVVFWALLIMHGPIFWYFFIVPGFIYIIERIVNSKPVKLARQGKVFVKEISLLPSKVTQLVITRPSSFHYKPGDYIFINIPQIAQYEWHPFTISSAPEMSDEIWIHVRTAGHWTGKLHEFFDKYDPDIHSDVVTVDLEEGYIGNDVSFKGQAAGKNGVHGKSFKAIADNNKNVVEKRDRTKDRVKKVKVQCYLDGPYGTATREIFETEHAVLIGSGIGVTPFASILQSVMFRYNIAKRQCPKCDHVWFGNVPSNVMKLNKLNFIWINRDQRSFEWFVSLLARLEKQQTEGDAESSSSFDHFFDMEMYMTSALCKSDMKGMALQLAMEMMHKKGGKDVVTGLKTRTQPGRPNWDEIFSRISKENKGKVKVFFCGSPILAKSLKTMCETYGLEFAKENF